MILETCRQKSEFIKEEQPDIIAKLDWSTISGVHPFLVGGKILKFLQEHNIPAIGEVDVERVGQGRLYWDDYLDIGNRTFFYFKNEPTYLDPATNPEYNICRLICPICKELCGGVSDHIKLTEDILPPERQYHGCMNQHRWLSLEAGKKVRYQSVESVLIGGSCIEIEKIEEELPEKPTDPIRSIDVE